MKLDSNRRETRVPTVILYLAAAVVGAPFFLLALAMVSVNGTWLMFVAAAPPCTAFLALWFWLRRPSSEGSKVSMGVLAQEAYPPGA